MANLVIQIGGGAKHEPDNQLKAVYVDIGQHAREGDSIKDHSQKEAAIANFMKEAARLGGVRVEQSYLDQLAAEFAKGAVNFDDVQVKAGVYGILSQYPGFSLTEEEMSKLYWEAVGGIKYKMREIVNVDAIRNSLRQIFTWIPGERVINPEFGSNVRLYLYEQLTPVNEEKIMAEIRGCVTKWEPRVLIDSIQRLTDVDDAENNTVRVQVVFRVIGLDDEQFTYVI